MLQGDLAFDSTFVKLVKKLIGIASAPCSVQSLVVFLLGLLLDISCLRVCICTDKNGMVLPCALIGPLMTPQFCRCSLSDTQEHVLTLGVVSDSLHASWGCLASHLVILTILYLVSEDAKLTLKVDLLHFLFPDLLKLDKLTFFRLDHLLKEVIHGPDQV